MTIVDIFKREVKIGDTVAFIQSIQQYIGIVKNFRDPNFALIKTHDGRETVAKVINRNCIIITEDIIDLLILQKLTD